LNAIQRTTASGVCAVVQAYTEGKLSGSGFQKQEDVPLETFTSNKFGKLYEQE
jgi:saccharopine dehydrogenase-like NADP-dependent oxidoreductase